MKKKLLLILLILNFSCKQNEQITYDLPEQNEIDSVFESIIKSDTLAFWKNNKFVLNVRKPHITLPNLDSIPKPPDSETIYFGQLFELKNGKERIFNRIDSAYILFQRDNYKTYKPSPNILKKIKYVSDNNSAEEVISLYQPIFTMNKKYAYVQSSHYYSGHWQGTYSYTLAKKGNNWKVINYDILWVF